MSEQPITLANLTQAQFFRVEDDELDTLDGFTRQVFNILIYVARHGNNATFRHDGSSYTVFSKSFQSMHFDSKFSFFEHMYAVQAKLSSMIEGFGPSNMSTDGEIGSQDITINI